MQVDHTIWGNGTDITGFPNTMKFSDTFRTLAQNGYISVDAYPDESIYQNFCTDDTLCISRYVKIDHVQGESLDITSEFYTPKITNYFPAYTTDTGGAGNGAICNAYEACYNGNRFGMNSTISLMPSVRPCVEMATQYFVLCVYCEVCTFSSENTYLGVRNFNTTNTQIMEYSDVLTAIENDENYWDNHYVSKMFVKTYYGTRYNRATDEFYLGLGVSRFPKIPATTFVNDPIYGPYIYEGDYNKQILLMPYSDVGSYIYGENKVLQQGGTWYDDAKLDKIRIIYIARCNPSFWSLGVRNMPDGNYVWLTSYINDTLSLTSAYAAYRSTGFKFTGDADIAQSGDADDPSLWSRGTPTADGGIDPSTAASDDEMNVGLVDDPENYGDNGYHGNSDVVDTNDYTDSTPIEPPTLSTLNAFNRTFCVNYTTLKSLANWLWNADESIFDEIVAGLALHGENPIDGIIDVRLYPFAVNALTTAATTDHIIIGRVDSEISGYLLPIDSRCVINMGSCSFFTTNKNFLDYKPFTEARLYIPYIGIVPIDTSEFMGHEISVKMIVDFVTGACTAMIYKDSIIVLYAQGTIGVDIPFSGTNSAAFANSVLSSVIGGASGVVTGAMTGNVGEVATSAGSTLFSGFTTSTQYQQGGSATANCGNWQPQYCYFIIDRPIPTPPENYGHCVGYACEIYDTLSSFGGFTMVANPDLSGILATDREKEEIKSLLQEGVYL